MGMELGMGRNGTGKWGGTRVDWDGVGLGMRWNGTGDGTWIEMEWDWEGMGLGMGLGVVRPLRFLLSKDFRFIFWSL